MVSASRLRHLIPAVRMVAAARRTVPAAEKGERDGIRIHLSSQHHLGPGLGLDSYSEIGVWRV